MSLKIFARIFFYCVLSLPFFACSDKYKTVHEQYITVNPDDLKDDTIISEAISPKVFSRLHKPSAFGRMALYKLSTEQTGKQFYLVFNGKIRSNYAQSNSTIAVITHNSKNEQVNWFSLFLRRHYTDINTWCNFKDSIIVRSTGKDFNSITCVVFLAASSAENFDVDSLHVAFKQKI